MEVCRAGSPVVEDGKGKEVLRAKESFVHEEENDASYAKNKRDLRKFSSLKNNGGVATLTRVCQLSHG